MTTLFAPNRSLHCVSHYWKVAIACLLIMTTSSQDASANWGWYRNLDFNIARTRHAMEVYPAGSSFATLTQLVMLFGGRSLSGQALNSVEVGSGNQWVMSYANNGGGPVYFAGAPMPTARYGLEAVTHLNGLCYIMGGTTGSTVLNTVEVYNPISNTWATGVPMPTPRMDFGSFLHNGKIYVVGGFNATGPLASMDCFDPATGVWTSLPGMPTARGGLMVYGGTNSIYALGGQTSPVGTPFAPGPLSVVERYDISTGVWYSELPMMIPLSYGAEGSKQNIYGWGSLIIGGYGPTGQAIPYVLSRTPGYHPAYPFFSHIITDSIIDTSVPWPYPLYPLAEAAGSYGVGAYETIQGFTGGRNASGMALSGSFTNLILIVLEDNRLNLEVSTQGNTASLQGVIESGDDFVEVWFERSFDGETFFRIGAVQPYDPSALQGEIIYENDNLATSLSYYRFVAAKADGSMSHSNIVNVRIDQEFDLSFFPNPFTASGNVSLQGITTGEPIQYALYDLNGREILAGRYQWQGNHILGGQELAAGTYFLKVRTNRAEKTIRIVRN